MFFSILLTARYVQLYDEGEEMSNVTLKEIQNLYGISRRAIQGYEKEGLVYATSKNKYGHLLYDENMVERIRRIKILQDIGFSVKQIKEILTKPEELKCVLVDSLAKLESEKKRIDTLIELVNKTF